MVTLTKDELARFHKYLLNARLFVHVASRRIFPGLPNIKIEKGLRADYMAPEFQPG